MLAGTTARLNRRTLLAGGVGAALLPLSGCGAFEDDPKPVLVGRREDVLSVGAGLVVDEADTTPVTLDAAVQEADWQQPGRVPSHQAVNARTGGLKRSWSASIGTGQTGRSVLAAQPVVGGNRIFVMDALGIVSAFDPGNGERIWRTDTKPKKSRSSNIGGGVSFSDGVLYVVDGVAESMALDAATGHIRWRVDVGTPGRSAPTVAGDRMFFGTIDERLFALDVSAGKQLWVYQASASDTVVFGQPAPAVVPGTVLAGFGSGDIAALREETGELLWSDTLGSTGGRNSLLDFSSVHGLPVIADGTAYVVSVGRVLTAIDLRSGRRLWERAVSGKDDLVVSGEWLFVLSQDAQLACLDRLNGHVRWVTTLPRFRRPRSNGGPIGWAGPLLANSELICVSDFPKQAMLRIDAVSGAIAGTIGLPTVAALPPIAAGGRMLLVAQDGTLTAFG